MEIERICRDNELIVTEWSPIHLRAKLQELYWKNDTVAVQAQTFWEDSQKFLYLPRLRSRQVLEKAIRAGAASTGIFWHPPTDKRMADSKASNSETQCARWTEPCS
jgi:predicted AAA+ superfamily ATPase